MAELLVMARDNQHPDPEKDERASWKWGDVVLAKPDGHKWGSMECLPAFYIIKLPGIPVEDVQEWCEPEVDTNGRLKKRRKTILDIRKLQRKPGKFMEPLQELELLGTLTIDTKEEIMACISDRVIKRKLINGLKDNGGGTTRSVGTTKH